MEQGQDRGARLPPSPSTPGLRPLQSRAVNNTLNYSSAHRPERSVSQTTALREALIFFLIEGLPTRYLL